jgi:hypothetical protein
MERDTPAPDLEHVEGAIICYSRCMVCGRQTPHEVCHAHCHAMGGGYTIREIDAGYVNFDMEPEQCSNPSCPAADR